MQEATNTSSIAFSVTVGITPETNEPTSKRRKVDKLRGSMLSALVYLAHSSTVRGKSLWYSEQDSAEYVWCMMINVVNPALACSFVWFLSVYFRFAGGCNAVACSSLNRTTSRAAPGVWRTAPYEARAVVPRRHRHRAPAPHPTAAPPRRRRTGHRHRTPPHRT